MAISNDLFLAILAMDSYNRGYNAGLGNPETGLGGTQIGNATIGLAKGDQQAKDASFFAQSYTWNGQTIISYRGTDAGSDIWNGWGTGISGYLTAQAQLAAQFYQQVNGGTTANPNIVLTGHSLGGGLAGFVGEIYGGTRAVMFDNMAFEAAASELYRVTQTVGSPQYNPDAANIYFNGQTPPTQSTANFQTYYVSGEALTLNRLSQVTSQTSINPHVGTFELGATAPLFKLHSQALLIILKWAEENNKQSWFNIAYPLLSALFDSTLGTALGQVQGTTGNDDPSTQLMKMVAYSAIDEGYKPFGDKGIQALFNDADEFGQLVNPNAGHSVAAYLNNAKVQKAIADIVVEYAGLLAKNAIIASSSANDTTGYEKGAIFFDQANNLLIGDFLRALWSVGSNQVDVVGKKTLTDAVSTFGGYVSGSSAQGIAKIWNGNSDHVVKLVATTTDTAVTLNAVADAGMSALPNPPNNDGAMLVGGGGNDTLQGAAGDDLLVGGAGNDTFLGNGGKDLMFGGAGDDQFNLGQAGVYWADGGAGKDSVNYTQSTHGHQLTISKESAGDVGPNGEVILKIKDTTTNDTDYVLSVEKITLNDQPDVVKVLSYASGGVSGVLPAPGAFYAAI